MKYNLTSRRMFLQGVGSMLPIPFLASLLPRECWAAVAGSAPRRFISVISGFDYGIHRSWFPLIPGSAFGELPLPKNKVVVGGGHPDVHYQMLRDCAPTNSSSVSPILGNYLSPYLESVNILRSLDHLSMVGHLTGHALGGISSDRVESNGKLKLIPTIDHVLNNNRVFNPAGLPLSFWGDKSSVGARTSSWSYALTGDSASSMNSTTEFLIAYNQLFNTGTHPESGTATLTHPKADPLSRVLEDYKRMQNSRTISSADKIALANAADIFSDVQKGLTQTAREGCFHKALGASFPPREKLDSDNVSAVAGKLKADLITAAIMCDTSRVFTLGTGPAGGVVDGIKFTHGNEGPTHNPFGIVSGKRNWERMAERQKYLFQNFVGPLVKNLAGATDPANGKSYLYNSLVYVTMESAQVHSNLSQPALLIGNAGGGIQSGRYIDYADRSQGPYGNPVDPKTGEEPQFSSVVGSDLFSNNWRGVIYNRILATILQGMGLAPADYERPELNSLVYGRSDIGAQNAGLTRIGGYGYVAPADISLTGDYGSGVTKRMLPNYKLSTAGDRLPLL